MSPRFTAFLLIMLVGAAMPDGPTMVVFAQEQAPTGEAAGEQGGARAKQDGSADLIGRIGAMADEIKALRSEFRQAKGEDQMLIESQLLRKEAEIRELIDELLSDIRKRAAEGGDTEALVQTATKLIDQDTGFLREEIDTIHKRLADFRTQRETVATERAVALEQQIAGLSDALNKLYRALLANTERKSRLDLDPTQDLQHVDQVVKQRAANVAGRIELTLDQVKDLKQQLSRAAEGEKAPLETRLTALDVKKKTNTDALSALVKMMQVRGLDTADYDQLLIRATGQISAEILDTDVAMGLAQEWGDRVLEWLRDKGPATLVKVLVIILILFVFKVLSNLAGRLVGKAITTSRLRTSTLLSEFFVNAFKKLVMLIGVLVALSQIGIQVGPLLAGLGVVGFIVGFALQDTLSNFASGMMILVYRPYDVGDVIEAAGVNGKVKEMSLVSTTVLTFDNQKLVVPNNKIWGDVIRNVTAQKMRRVDMTFGIGYGDDILKAERVLTDIVSADPGVLAEPEPVIKLHTLGESSVDFIVRPWVMTENYWPVYWGITRAVKERFDAEGISIPFPQRDVHLYQAPTQA